MGAPDQSVSNTYNAIHDDRLQLTGSNSTLSSGLGLHELYHGDQHPHDVTSHSMEEQELGAESSIESLKRESSDVVSNSSQYLHMSGKNGKRSSAWSARRSAQRKQKISRKSIHKYPSLALLSSTVPNTNKCTDEESILREVIAYVQGLQKQVKDIKADIAMLQINRKQE